MSPTAELGAWLTVEQVQAYLLGGNHAFTADAWADQCVVTAREWVESRRPDVDYSNPPESIVTGATMLAGRWYLRRGSANGIAGTFETGAYLPRTDRDIEMLLGIKRPVAR